MECLADCGEGPVVMVGEETFENIEGKKAKKFADLLVKEKLNNSKDFVSYEGNLVTKSPPSKTTKKK